MVNGVNRSYESQVKKKYSEFKKVGIGTWNAVKFNGRWVNMYTDPALIRELFTDKIESNFKGKDNLTILDLGGGDGTLISLIGRQLEDKFKLDLFNMDLNDDSLKICQKNNPNIKIIKQNILTPSEPNFADVVLCRFVMQYQSKEEQIKIIENAHSILKKGGLFFVLWPTHPNKDYINEMESEVVHIITGKDKKEAKVSRYFASEDEMIKNMEKEKFKVVFSSGLKIKQYYSVNGWSDRFNLSEDQESRLTALFNSFEKKYPKMFETIDGIQNHEGFHCLVIGKK